MQVFKLRIIGLHQDANKTECCKTVRSLLKVDYPTASYIIEAAARNQVQTIEVNLDTVEDFIKEQLTLTGLRLTL